MPEELHTAHLDALHHLAASRAISQVSGPVRCRVSDKYEFPASVPPTGIDRALNRFMRAFDRSLLARHHAVIRSALAAYELMRIASYDRVDRRVADLLVQALLRQGGLPPLPITLVQYRRYWEVSQVLQDSLTIDLCQLAQKVPVNDDIVLQHHILIGVMQILPSGVVAEIDAELAGAQRAPLCGDCVLLVVLQRGMQAGMRGMQERGSSTVVANIMRRLADNDVDCVRFGGWAEEAQGL